VGGDFKIKLRKEGVMPEGGREWNRRGEAVVRLDEAWDGFGPCTLQCPRRDAKPTTL